jgi:hypothetical protein
MNTLTLIADNGGGITLQVVNTDNGIKYQHFYTHPSAHCAGDVQCALNGEDVRDWDGNEAEAGWLTPTPAEIESGGYRVLIVSCSKDVFEWGRGDESWLNISELSEFFAGVVEMVRDGGVVYTDEIPDPTIN